MNSQMKLILCVVAFLVVAHMAMSSPMELVCSTVHCGGFAGFKCCDGYICQAATKCCDMLGTCIKINGTGH